MTSEDRQALHRIFVAVQMLLPAAQSWYTQATGGIDVPPEITNLRLTIIDPVIARLITPVKENSNAR